MYDHIAIYNFKYENIFCDIKIDLNVKIIEKDSLSWDADRKAEVVIQPFLKR